MRWIVIEGYARHIGRVAALDRHNWRLCHSILKFKHFPSPQILDTTSALLLSFFAEFKLRTKIRAVAIDCGPEMSPEMKIFMRFLNDHYDLHLDPDWNNRSDCHIMNRSVIDCVTLVKKVAQKMQEILTVICTTLKIREGFKRVQNTLGTSMKHVENLYGLNVENRWNMMFNMIDACYKLKGVFKAVRNNNKFCEKLYKLTQPEWREVKTAKELLKALLELTIAASGSKNTSFSKLSLIFSCLEKYRRSTSRENLPAGSTSLLAEMAAEVIILSLNKLKNKMASPLIKLTVALDFFDVQA